MKKIILILFMIPIFSFGQENSNTKNGLENLLEKAEKLVENIDISFNKKEEKKIDLNLENKIINLWKNYSKAFEYKDYEKVASFFSYPSTFGTSSNSIILNNKSELIKKYKNIRSNVLMEALDLINGDREQVYGTPKENFNKIAKPCNSKKVLFYHNF